jgi:outer membrane protein OmpA-like peptidoglycan-associated protein
VTSQLTAGPAGTPAPAAPAAPRAATQQRLNTLPQITFQTGTTRLTAAGLRAVRQAAAILRANPSIKVRIQGHTDDVGDATANLTLSTARAERVRAVLHQLGIAHERMSYIGYGESRPRLANSSDANRAVNRRVEFRVL